uniref:Uncharacterized protein n=1 Tax=Manihot esculenta TaxID=3983 RepID=A0A2C9UI46_MANES
MKTEEKIREGHVTVAKNSFCFTFSCINQQVEKPWILDFHKYAPAKAASSLIS